jgi:transcriptional regulator with XRE-family HTH domain
MKGMGNDLIREARRRQGLTQTELARLAGTTQSAIARLESGRTSPAFDDVIRLLRLMGMDLDFMLVERDDSDWIQAQRRLGASATEQHDALVAFARTVQNHRAEFERSVA